MEAGYYFPDMSPLSSVRASITGIVILVISFVTVLVELHAA